MVKNFNGHKADQIHDKKKKRLKSVNFVKYLACYQSLKSPFVLSSLFSMKQWIRIPHS